MQFAEPLYLNLVWAGPAFLILVLLYAVRKHRKMLGHLADSSLASRLVNDNRSLFRVRNILLLWVVAAISVSIARPQVGSGTAVARRRGIDLIIGIDTSLSMTARDVNPSRLEVAKRAAGNLIDDLAGDRVGLVIFAGTAFVQCPLTLDYGAALMFLDSIDAGSIPVPGTSVGEAIMKAVEMAPEDEKSNRVLVLFTDGEDHGGDPIEAAREARDSGFVIYTIGLGSEAGEPIPMEEGEGYKRDKEGEVVMTRLQAESLRRISIATGGKFYRASQTGEELDRIILEISDMEKRELESRIYTDYREWFQLPLLVGLLLLLIETAIPEVVGSRRKHG
jgi:Ca-activated chloride channel family protein